MKLYTLTSDYYSLPLAEIRTDGKSIEFTVDNTEGRMPKITGNKLSKLLEVVSKSHHLHLEQTKNPTIGLYPFLLENGDVIKITSDGKTALLNGNLLNEIEKQALFHALQTKQLKVKNKPNVGSPIPIIAQVNQVSSPKQPHLNYKMNPFLEKAAHKELAKKRKIREASSKDYDIEIENFKTDHPDPKFIKKLFYLLRYGD